MLVRLRRPKSFFMIPLKYFEASSQRERWTEGQRQREGDEDADGGNAQTDIDRERQGGS